MDPVVIGAGALAGVGLLGAGINTLAQQSSNGRVKHVTGPGWIARRRADGGFRKHPRAAIAVGYASMLHRATLSMRDLDLGGLILGTKGSGKTYALALLIEALASQKRACVVLDPKPSRDLAEVVAGVDGIIWTIGGRRQWDALPDDPSELANQLVEVLPVDARTKVYRDAARLWVLVAAQALRRDSIHPTIEHMALLCRPRGLSDRLKAQKRLDDLPRLSQTELDGVIALGTTLSILSRGTAGPSLGSGPGSLRLEEAMDEGKVVLLQLAAGPYPEETRVLGAWALRCMLRLLRHPSPCVLMCDEFARLGVQGRAALELLALGREFGKAVILATQGPSDLDELGPHALDQVAQDAGWILAFRQGTRDSATASRLLGVRRDNEYSIRSDGEWSMRHVQAWGHATAGIGERVNVPPSFLERIKPAIAVLRSPTGNAGEPRIDVIRVGRPGLIGAGVEIEKTVPAVPMVGKSESGRDTGTAQASPDEGDVPVPLPTSDADYERIMRRLKEEGERTAEGCRLWPKAGCNSEGYAKATIKGRQPTLHKWLWEREHGPVPRGWSLDHRCHREAKARGECRGGPSCPHRRCLELEHIDAMPRGEHSSRTEHRQANANLRPEGGAARAPSVAMAPALRIALYEAIDKPAIQARTVSIEDLAAMLGQFNVLADKRQGRCWSPAKYADGASSRGNAGVESVSCLVFDLDRVPPDHERLAGVYWIGHTTWSHTPQSPRWRVVIPLARPVPAGQWSEVWRRARAALCPEADPQCKDASRQYYLPSHRSGVMPEATCHDGPLLDAATLPPLPPKPMRPDLQLLPAGAALRKSTDRDHRRAEAYLDGVIRNLARATKPGRNAALNRAAWTLGHWIAAGVLDQGEIEDALFAAAEQNGLVSDPEDGPRKTWATIRSGLSKGLLQPVDLDTDDWSPPPRPRHRRRHDPR